jgi:signal transduction histidine kinase
MTLNYPQRLWLPYLVAAIGILGSLVLWYVLKQDIEPYARMHPTMETYHPWVVMTLGMGISILVAILIRVAQLSRQRAISLDQMNEDLKKSMAELIHAEESKQKLEIALLQGQKLQAIGTLAGGIAHDFNNILYAVIGYTELSREDVAKDSLVHKNLGKVLDAARRGQELVSRILTFSRRQHHDFNPISLTETIEAALSLLTPTIPASVMINFKSAGEMVILGNQTQIHQVLVNIINNAVDAMDGEGTINIHMTAIAKNDPYLKQFPDTLPQNYCKIDISDTGHGMDQPTMERIFEPFFTTKEVGKGTGLGMSIVHSIIEEHDGEITISSQIGHGTTFTILLPVMEDK